MNHFLHAVGRVLGLAAVNIEMNLSGKTNSWSV